LLIIPAHRNHIDDRLQHDDVTACLGLRITGRWRPTGLPPVRVS